MDNQFIPVKEFSKRAGVTPQAVYKQLNNQLKDSLKVENGKKLININALSLFKIKQETIIEQPVEQQLNNQLNNQLTISLQATIDILKAENESLNKQIIEQNNQINSLMELNKNNQILLLNQQQLLTGTVPGQQKRKSIWSRIFNKEPQQ